MRLRNYLKLGLWPCMLIIGAKYIRPVREFISGVTSPVISSCSAKSHGPPSKGHNAIPLIRLRDCSWASGMGPYLL